MSDEEMQEARRRLEALRDEVKAEQEATAEDAAPVELDQTRVGRLSRMDSMQQQAMQVEQKRRREIQLKRIEGAFLRLDKGVYGLCATCGVQIEQKRLDFDPTIFFCSDCAAKAERR